MAANILIADDDAVQRRLVEVMVQNCGYETVVVDSGDAKGENRKAEAGKLTTIMQAFCGSLN